MDADNINAASRNDFRAFCNSFSVTAKSPSTTAFSSLPANAAQVLTPIVLSMVTPCIFASRPKVNLIMPLFASPLDMKNFIQRIGGYCAGVRQRWLEERIGRRWLSGAKRSHLIVKKPDGGGKMLKRVFTFDVHEETVWGGRKRSDCAKR